jgi:hypothetical protein
MSRYERVLSPVEWQSLTVHQVSGNEDNEFRRNTLEDDSPSSPSAHVNTPISSRPPSFSSLDPLSDQSEQHELAASFQLDEDEDDDEEHNNKYNERSRLHPSTSTSSLASTVSRRSTSALHSSSNAPSLLAVPSPFGREEITSTPSNFVPRTGTDGVFANLAAKPDSSEAPDGKYDEPLPSYESAAADAAPPYWETTIITPGMDTDEVYVDGLPVGNFFAFIWNAMISMSFQFVGFLLTYLLASTHAARNGSRAGLGVILIQYGFYLRDAPAMQIPDGAVLPDPDSPPDSTTVGDNGPVPNDDMQETLPKAEWMSYLLMVIGWFILIRSVGEYYRVKQLEKAVRATPSVLGAPAAIVAEGEGEQAV